jgi:septal ring factor EnvC (AmiA/AmiB activator)
MRGYVFIRKCTCDSGLSHSMKNKIVVSFLIAGTLMLPSVCGAERLDLQQTLKQMADLLAEQQKELDEQRKELAAQRALIRQLQNAQQVKETGVEAANDPGS